MLVSFTRWTARVRPRQPLDPSLTFSLVDQPVTYNYYGQVSVDELFGSDDGVERFIRWRVQLMERVIDLLEFGSGHDTSVQVHDYLDVSMLSVDPRVRQASKKIIELFQNHYPEMLSRKCACH